MPKLEKQLDACRDLFIQHFGEPPFFLAHAPGRINIIGEHTDYNQGLSLPCAINRWVTVSVTPRKDRTIHLISENFFGEMRLELNGDYTPTTSWQQYLYGCILLFQEKNPLPSGFQGVIAGNVPIGSGVSSSAALEVAFMNALNALANYPLSPMELILLCQQTEHQYLQVKSGLLDQYASQFSKANQAMILDFEDLSHEYIDANIPEHNWVLCDSNVQRTLAGSKYSERVRETQDGWHTLQKLFPSLRSLRAVEEKHLPSLQQPHQQKRLRHYILENKRVTDTVKALAIGDLEKVGQLLTASHLSLRDDYEVSCKELDYLVKEAIASGYCLGSRMMGGGFGGCTINLVKTSNIPAFREVIEASYFKQFKRETEVNVYQSVNGAGVISELKHV